MEVVDGVSAACRMGVICTTLCVLGCEVCGRTSCQQLRGVHAIETPCIQEEAQPSHYTPPTRMGMRPYMRPSTAVPSQPHAADTTTTVLCAVLYSH